MIIDIALPFHGNVQLFKKTVLSVLAQTSDSWRLLILNDAHPDKEVDFWVTKLNDKRIIYQRNENNLGPSLNYSKCVEMISANHCIILGADDIMCEDYVEKMMIAIKSYPNSDFYHPAVKVIDENGNDYLPLVDKVKRILQPKVHKIVEIEANQALIPIMLGNWMYFPAITWKSVTVRKFGFRPDLNVCQDIWLITQILISGGKFAVLPQVLLKYRRFSGSDSSLKLLNGIRFAEEKLIYDALAKQTWNKKMPLVSVAAKLHLTSRLHAMSLLPKAIFTKQNPKTLLKHIIT